MPLTPDERKEQIEIQKQGIDLWMEKKWAAFGRWTARGIAVFLFGLLCKYIAVHGGAQ